MPSAGHYRLFLAPEADLDDDTDRVGSLADAWLASQNRNPPDAQAVRRVERKLHDAIKAGPLFGKILSFAGLNLWVDERTADGLVMSQECMNL